MSTMSDAVPVAYPAVISRAARPTTTRTGPSNGCRPRPRSGIPAKAATLTTVFPAKAGTQVRGVEPHPTPVIPDSDRGSQQKPQLSPPSFRRRPEPRCGAWNRTQPSSSPTPIGDLRAKPSFTNPNTRSNITLSRFDKRCPCQPTLSDVTGDNSAVIEVVLTLY